MTLASQSIFKPFASCLPHNLQPFIHIGVSFPFSTKTKNQKKITRRISVDQTSSKQKMTTSIIKIMPLLLVIASAFLVQSTSYGMTACFKAYQKCDFKFVKYPLKYRYSIMGKPDRSFTPRIISKSSMMKIGILNTYFTAQFIMGNGKAMNITKFGKPALTPSHFKPFPINGTMQSGIGHQTFDGNQMKVSMNRCVRLYFSSFQVLDSYGLVIDNMNDVPMSMNKCVVFRTWFVHSWCDSLLNRFHFNSFNVLNKLACSQIEPPSVLS